MEMLRIKICFGDGLREEILGDEKYGDVENMVFLGKTLRGFCGGAFGRDSYGDKVIEVEGSDWIVVREDGIPEFASFDSEQDKINKITDWIKEYDVDMEIKND